MDMHSREQYLEALREEYRGTSKKQKKRLLNEAPKRTRLSRKVLIRKLAGRPLGRAPVKAAQKRRRRGKTYGAEVKAPLAQVWEIFDYPCGQRLAPVRPLLYQRVPAKLPNEWDRDQVGNLQLDLVVHCRRSMAGEYVHTLSAVDFASGWWEGEPRMGRSQKATEGGFTALRLRFPYRVREVHPDNDSALLNDLLWKYCRKRRIAMSRSRPYEKKNNAWVEQKNWTHVCKVVGYRRYDRPAEQVLLRTLYRKLAEFQNFFQPVMKLKENVREGGKVHRVLRPKRNPVQDRDCW